MVDDDIEVGHAADTAADNDVARRTIIVIIIIIIIVSVATTTTTTNSPPSIERDHGRHCRVAPTPCMTAARCRTAVTT